jgi:hypothetical protein
VSNVRAFTLLELLLATALTALLMIGVLAVVADLGAPEAAAGPVPGREEARAFEACLDLLHEDLTHAVAVNASKANELTLVGYASLDGCGRERTHRPVRVRYTLEQIDGRSWLVRRQDALDVRTSENLQRDLVCCGFRGFQLLQDRYAWGLDEEASEGEAPADGPPAGGGGAAAAAAVRAKARTEKDVRFNEDGERRTYTIGTSGAGYYFEFLPAWMQQQIMNHGRIVHDLTATVEDQQRQLEQAIRDTGVDLRGAGTLWRLRVWTGEQGDTVRERIVTIQLGGGA